MGIGDNIMASGLARGVADRGKRIAFGDGRRIIWDKHSPQIFEGNRNIAPPGSEGSKDLEWVQFYKGHRLYNTLCSERWIWRKTFRAIPGEIFLADKEKRLGERYGKGFILIEPNVETWKSVAPNKDWGFKRYQAVADRLREGGYRVVQFRYGTRPTLVNVDGAPTVSFRDAVSIMRNARLYIGPEGGLHHAAAAVGIPAVVLFGGFIPPEVTGYATHINLTGGAEEACGSLSPCQHCRTALDAISVDEVVAAAKETQEKLAA